MTTSVSTSTQDRASAPPTDLTGRTVLVTGGGRGLGAVISERMARAGARVALTGRDEATLSAWAGRLPGESMVVAADLSQPDAPAQVLEQVLERFGALDVLVNNAAVAPFGPSHELTAADVDAVLALNVRAPLLLASAAAAHMAGRGGGSIVNISSGLGDIGSAGSSLYGTSKGAVDAMTRSLAAEWGPAGVRVNAVRVGLVRSDSTAFLVGNDELRGRYEQRVPLRRLGEAEDVAEAVAFLGSAAAAYVTGQSLNLDGGTSTTAPSPLAAP